jgi:hypothetical protein
VLLRDVDRLWVEEITLAGRRRRRSRPSSAVAAKRWKHGLQTIFTSD